MMAVMMMMNVITYKNECSPPFSPMRPVYPAKFETAAAAAAVTEQLQLEQNLHKKFSIDSQCEYKSFTNR